MRLLPCRWTRSAAAGLLLLAATAAHAQTACPPPPPTAEAVREAGARQPARDRGVLWRLEKDGRTSWLYGTLHVNRVEWAAPGPRIQRALRDSDVLALELDLADPELPRLFAQPGDPQRAARVVAGLQPQLERLAARACLPPERVASLRPLLQLMMLGLADARHQGLHPEIGVDAVLWQMARIFGKPVVALETPAQQLAGLLPESEADERELFVQGVRQLEDGEGRALVQKLAQLWGDGDAATLAEYPRWCRCMETPAELRYERALNSGRNVGIADKLAALHDGGQRVFAAIGALHMTGPQAVPVLLRSRGFDVRFIPFTTP